MSESLIVPLATTTRDEAAIGGEVCQLTPWMRLSSATSILPFGSLPTALPFEDELHRSEDASVRFHTPKGPALRAGASGGLSKINANSSLGMARHPT